MSIFVEYIVQKHPQRDRWSVERKQPHVANMVIATYRNEWPAEQVAAKLNQWVRSEEQ